MLRRHLQRCLVICFGFFQGICAEAVAPDAASRHWQFRITHWTSDQGLTQNTVLSLAQTRDGYLWVGTPGGLARFDGVRFTLFDRSNTPELESESIQALAEDADGALWI